MSSTRDSCSVCDGRIDVWGRDGTRCARCSQPCPTCGGDVSTCSHPLAEAEALLRAYRMLGQGDLSGDFTELPMEGVEITPAVRKAERFSWHIDDETGRGSIAA